MALPLVYHDIQVLRKKSASGVLSNGTFAATQKSLRLECLQNFMFRPKNFVIGLYYDLYPLQKFRRFSMYSLWELYRPYIESYNKIIRPKYKILEAFQPQTFLGRGESAIR